VPVQRCTLTLLIPLYPFGQYSLYRVSVPVERCTLTLPISIITLWAVRSVQSLNACTTVHFTFTCTSTPPFGQYSLYRASVPVKRCTLTLPIPLLPLWTVQPLQSLSACTTVHFNFTYTSTPPMDRTASTEPQCLYNGALYLYLYLYSPYGPYGLYRSSVPLQRCSLSLAISLPPIGLRACTKPQCWYKDAL